MSSKTSTSAAPDTGFRPWHLYILLSMIAATAAVILSKQTHPVVLLVLSAAVMAAGVTGLAVHHALAGFTGNRPLDEGLRDREREGMLSDKALVLRSIKELEFDHATGKISDADFAEMNQRLRLHAMTLMEALERAPEERPVASKRPVPSPACPSCKTLNDADAKFCKQCGHRLA